MDIDAFIGPPAPPLSEWEEFLVTICENPEDRAPQLIYADWCDDHGEPNLAKVLRLQYGGDMISAAFQVLGAERDRRGKITIRRADGRAAVRAWIRPGGFWSKLDVSHRKE